MNLTVVAFQPRRNITLAVEHAPDFDMRLALNVGLPLFFLQISG